MTLALVLLCIILSILTPRFLTVGNFRNLLWQATAMGIISIGQTLVILTSGIDLSVGGIAAFSAMFGGMILMKVGVPFGILAILAIGMLVGVINGFLIAYTKLAPFIVTLGMLSITRSLTYVVNDGRSLVGLPKAYRFFGSATVGGIPLYTLIFLSVFIVGHIMLTKTKIGRFLYAIGSNEEAARLTGVNVNFYKAIAYVFTGCLCAISVIILTSRLGAIDPDTGMGIELDTIAAVVIGGSSLLGGKGSLIGTFIGVFLITILHNGLNLIGVSPFWQGSAVGSVIIISVLVDRLLS
ncbi:ribose ABC transporter permease [candidate division KSB3 bacterium]|uniref:Ribose ABC transporter permease n=1 Tax=candidate division KSB3 bacterium TaxID=2044937 RepID=A0A9D5Q760_9BACT|nr:ribose ABC transporter permease [candidate division KSB3 bacterium]MBD3326520.1 ribose ABC transporter permease [candidate division KSB3 bacterium]